MSQERVLHKKIFLTIFHNTPIHVSRETIQLLEDGKRTQTVFQSLKSQLSTHSITQPGSIPRKQFTSVLSNYSEHSQTIILWQLDLTSLLNLAESSNEKISIRAQNVLIDKASHILRPLMGFSNLYITFVRQLFRIHRDQPNHATFEEFLHNFASSSSTYLLTKVKYFIITNAPPTTICIYSFALMCSLKMQPNTLNEQELEQLTLSLFNIFTETQHSQILASALILYKNHKNPKIQNAIQSIISNLINDCHNKDTLKTLQAVLPLITCPLNTLDMVLRINDLINSLPNEKHNANRREALALIREHNQRTT